MHADAAREGDEPSGAASCRSRRCGAAAVFPPHEEWTAWCPVGLFLNHPELMDETRTIVRARGRSRTAHTSERAQKNEVSRGHCTVHAAWPRCHR